MEHHPGYDVLPSKVKAVLMETARRLALVAGEPPPDDALYFVLNGALGFLPSGQRVCVGVIPPGSVLGWEAAVGASIHAHETRAILPTEGYVAPLKPVHALLKDAWIHQFLAAYAASRARALGVEAACNARHTALQRLAKWIARLHAADGEERGNSHHPGRIGGHARLAAHQYQRIVPPPAGSGSCPDSSCPNQDELWQATCDCDAGLAEGALERRLRNRLN